MSIENFKMPVGRIVSGNPTAFEEAKDFYTRETKLRNGEPLKENRVDVAYPKQEFLEKVWPFILQEVAKVYPQYANTHPDQCDTSRFAWKIINGDSPSCPQGSQVPYNVREGYKGCYIVKIRTSAFLPGTFKYENGAYRKVEPSEIKCGDYIVANVTINVHTQKDGGIYWNPNGYELVAYGTEIKSSGGGDPMKMFGGQNNYQLPAGASLTPISSAPVTAQMPGVTPAPVAMPTAPVAPVTPQPMPAPAYDFVQNAGMPQAAPQGFTQPVASAATPQQSAPQTVSGTAPFVTTFPTR